MSTGSRKLFWKPWSLPLSSVVSPFPQKSEQLDAIYAVVTGKDVFVKAATGFGKSVCFITIPYVCDYLLPV